MRKHIRAAEKVVRGHMNANNDLIQEGENSLSDNTVAWGRAMDRITQHGEEFERIWKNHVVLEGQYIEALFQCSCEGMGSCAQARRCTKILGQLRTNGHDMIRFLSLHFRNRPFWRKLWTAHLACVKSLIDTGKMASCKTKTKAEFRARVNHCLDSGVIIGNVLNRMAQG